MISNPTHTIGCTRDIPRPIENIHPLIAIWISPSLDGKHPLIYAFLICTKSDMNRHTQTERESDRECVCVRGRNPLVVFFTSPLRNYLAFWKIFVFLLSGETKEIILMMPEPQVTPQIIMMSRQVAQWNLQIHPHHWSRRHHKRFSCEPYTTHPEHNTPIIHELHLVG